MEANDKKIKVLRCNASLFVSEDKKQRYLDMGYNVITEDGKVVEKSTAKDVVTLRERCDELEAENATLKKQLNDVKKKLDELAKPKKRTSKKKED